MFFSFHQISITPEKSIIHDKTDSADAKVQIGQDSKDHMSEDPEENLKEWQLIGRIIDRFFFWITFSLTLVGTIVCFTLMLQAN